MSWFDKNPDLKKQIEKMQASLDSEADRQGIISNGSVSYTPMILNQSEFRNKHKINAKKYGRI